MTAGTQTNADATSVRLAHERILASAGSGKTWQLATRYLRIVHAGYDPQSMLASTFSRLAAGEIRDRILQRLVKAADDAAERSSLAAEFNVEALTREDVLHLLATLAQRIDRMNIRTLDSFFAAIVSAFPLEVGLPPGCRIVDEDEGGALRLEAVRRMLDEHDPQPLIETLRRLTRGKSTRRIYAAIDDVVATLDQFAHEADPSAWECIPTPPAPDYARITTLVADLWALDANGGRHFEKAHRKACECAQDADWLGFLGTGIAKRILEGGTSFDRVTFTRTIRAVYEPLIQEAIHIVVGQYAAVNLATRDLLEKYTRQLHALKCERKVMTFNDLTVALDRAESLGTLEDVCYRLDQTLEHVLLDEFQDTSIPQWRAIEPIVAELAADMSTGRSVFCVGDLKQAIYEWRDASPEILDHLPELLFGKGAGDEQIVTRPLDVSWRSAQPVIACVNRVFDNLAASPTLVKHPDVANAWDRIFHAHQVAKPNRAMPGYVELRTIEPDRDGTKPVGEPKRIAAAVERAKALHELAPDRSIGIIVRSNNVAREILFRLQQCGLPVSGPGGGPLTDTAAVNAVVDLLQLAERPEDSAAAFHVASSPLGEAIGFTEWSHAGHRRARARDTRRAIYERGFGPFIAALVPRLAHACSDRERRRLLRLVDLAESVDATGSRDIGGIIRVIDERDVADALPTPIQVLTIHKAKGMEYDAVILPDLQSAFGGRTFEPIAFERADITGRITRITRDVKNFIREALARDFGCDLEPMFEARANTHTREALCMLYVAMTRARQALYMIIDPPRINKDGAFHSNDVRSMAGLLWHGLADNAQPPGPDALVYADGSEDWWPTDTTSTPAADRSAKAAPRAASPAVESAVPHEPDDLDSCTLFDMVDRDDAPAIVPPTATMQTATSIAAPSRTFAGPLRERLKRLDPEATDRGTAVHALFELIDWLEEDPADASPPVDRASMIRAVRELLPRRSDAWITDRIAEFTRDLQHEAVRELLRAPTAAASTRIWRERPFALVTDRGLVRGVIDRLEIYFDNAGSPTHARIIDYKTDTGSAAALAKKATQYTPQLHTYRDAVADMYSLDSRAIECILAFVHEGVVHTIEPQANTDESGG